MSRCRSRRQTPATGTGQAEPVPSVAASPLRILVVDDEAGVRGAYQQLFMDARNDAGHAERMALQARLFDSPAGAPAAEAPRAAGFAVRYCDGAVAAVEAVRMAFARSEPFAVAFIDVRMPPGPDGVWAAEQIRSIDPQIQIVVCTAYSDLDPAQIGARVLPEEKLFYLQKPVHPFEVRQMAFALGHKWICDRRIERLAYFDPLTGLASRAFFQRQLAAAIGSAASRGQRLALLYLDLDNFKRVNDTLGHSMGDELLVQMATRLRRLFPFEDAALSAGPAGPRSPGLARLGGDEFVVLLEALGEPGDAAAIAEGLVRELQQPIGLGGEEFRVSTSIGIAVYPDDAADAATLFRHADVAMYHAKRQGPGLVALFAQIPSHSDA